MNVCENSDSTPKEGVPHDLELYLKLASFVKSVTVVWKSERTNCTLICSLIFSCDNFDPF